MPGSTSRWRTIVAVVAVLIGSLLVPPALAAASVRTLVTDTDGFVAGYGPLIEDEEFQTWLTDQVVGIAMERAGLESLVDDALSGLAEDSRTSTRVALELLREPTVQGLRAVLTRATTTVVTSEQFATAWHSGLRLAHVQLNTLGADVPDALLRITPEGLVLQLGPLVELVRARLLEDGFTLAERIPAVDRGVLVVPSTSLASVHTWYQGALAAGVWLPVSVAVLLLVGVIAARNRPRAVGWAACGVVAGALVVLLLLALARSLAVDALNDGQLPAGVADQVWQATTNGLRWSVAVTILVALVVGVVAWVAGSSPWARHLRGSVRQFRLRRILEDRPSA